MGVGEGAALIKRKGASDDGRDGNEEEAEGDEGPGNLRNGGEEETSVPAKLRRCLDLPPWMRALCLMNGLVWVGWFCFLFFAADFIGIFVEGGDPHAAEHSPAFDRYQRAQHIFSLTQACRSVLIRPLSLSLSPPLPSLLRSLDSARASSGRKMAVMHHFSLVRPIMVRQYHEDTLTHRI